VRKVRWKEIVCLWRVAGHDVPVKAVVAKVAGYKKRFTLVTSAVELTGLQMVELFAARFRQENHLGEQIMSFHLDCLCSDVRLNVDFDLTLTVLADLLYRSLAERLKGFDRAGPSKLYRKFVDTPGQIEITAEGVIVRLSKRAHNPLLKEAGLTEPTRPVPWLGGRSVRLVCP
jgi:hypothetical protein